MERIGVNHYYKRKMYTETNSTLSVLPAVDNSSQDNIQVIQHDEGYDFYKVSVWLGVVALGVSFWGFLFALIS